LPPSNNTDILYPS